MPCTNYYFIYKQMLPFCIHCRAECSSFFNIIYILTNVDVFVDINKTFQLVTN